jgi:MATE family multidrug resistance protein
MINKILQSFYQRWNCSGGYRELFVIAIPLIISTGAMSIQLFIDRMFLAWHSPAAIAASVPAAIMNWTVMSIFSGTASYAGTFIAQYYGAGVLKKIGPVMWQSIIVAVFAGIFMFSIIPIVGWFFKIVNHEPLVQAYEILYFKYLCLGAFPIVGTMAVSSFFSGIGKTRPVMWVNMSPFSADSQ